MNGAHEYFRLLSSCIANYYYYYYYLRNSSMYLVPTTAT